LNINDQVLAALSLYGLPVVFSVIFASSLGFPLPETFVMVVAGSFAELGDMNIWWVLALGAIAATVGDQAAYAIGHWGGHRLAQRFTGWFGGAKQLDKAENAMNRWGWAGIFFSRWLVTPLSPWINYTSGITRYSYRRFLLWDISGNVLWTILYVAAGVLFSDRVQALIETLGNLAWVEIGLIAAAIFGWLLYRSLRNNRKKNGVS
jgi:membrane protein DedA with SNARE-associated domain